MTRIWVAILLWVIFGGLYVTDAVNRIQKGQRSQAGPWREWGRW